MDYGVTHIWIITEICITVTVAEKHNYSVYKMMECKEKCVERRGREELIMHHGDESSTCHGWRCITSIPFTLCVMCV